jgi:hypothetical protein
LEYFFVCFLLAVAMTSRKPEPAVSVVCGYSNNEKKYYNNFDWLKRVRG